jgi:hypothetical protein
MRWPATEGDAARCIWPGRPGATGRDSGDGANGRPIERIGTIVRVGTARCKVDSWRRKSVTEEFGRFSTLDRSSGGIKTAAQAARTARSTILLMYYAIPLSDICSRSF